MAVLTGWSISPLEREADARECARLMASSEPWLTLGRSYEASLRIVQDPTREVLTGAFVGYIQTICIHPEQRGQGLGFNFNHDARRLYERLGHTSDSGRKG